MDAENYRNFEAPMPWIGMYIAGASAVCTIAMASNLVMGIISKKFWFPCSKYFSLNATLLTLLAVATKLNTDISNTKIAPNDRQADVSSLVLMSTTIVTCMTSLATMDDNVILLNLTALSILVITIVVDICIFMAVSIGTISGLLVVGLLFLLVILLFASAIVIPITRRSMEFNFRLKQNGFSAGDERVENGQVISTDELRIDLKRYWVMARTGNPEFVMARSVICVLPAFICLLMSFIMLQLHLQLDVFYPNDTSENYQSESSYSWSINWILWIQTGGVAIGIIAPLCRCYICANMWHSSFKDQVESETYWTRRLVEWRERSIPIRIHHQKHHVFLQNSKIFLLNICIQIQLVIVQASKLHLYLAILFFRLIHQIKKLISHDSSSSREEASEFGQYVLLLEGEPQLPCEMIADICNEFDKLVHVGEKQKLSHIDELLQLSKTFDGVREFCRDNNITDEQPHSWSLSVVTLTCITVALPLPNAMVTRVHLLVTAVSEGLFLVKHIEEIFETDQVAVRMRKVASTIWNKLQMCHKWLGKDINDKTPEMLLCMAKDILNHPEESTLTDSLDCHTRDIAAKSMLMICETLVLGGQTDHGEMFENLSRIISDILAACLTNLPRAIITMSQNNAPEESVKQAAILLGKTEEIIQNLEQRNKPSLKPEEKGNMDSWRAILKRDRENPINPVSPTDNRSVQETSDGYGGWIW